MNATGPGACFILAAALGGLCGPVWAAGANPPRGAGDPQEAIRLQQLMKKRYLELTRIMSEVSRRLEATDPTTAAALSAAAQRAEAALIADDMDKVISLLREGMVIPADATQAKVLMRLREVLNALRGEDGLEWRLFLIQELQQQMADLQALIERQQVLERQSRMLAFGDRMRAEIRETRGKVEGLVRDQEAVLALTRKLAPSPAAMEFTGIRQGLAGILRRFDTAHDALWNPTPPPDALMRNIVDVRRYHGEAAALRTDLRALLNREAVQQALASSPPELRGEKVIASVGRAVDELDRSAKAMTANDLTEGLLALSESKAQLQDALLHLDDVLLAFPGLQPAVRVAADQKKLDDAMTQVETPLRTLFPAGLGTVDDSPAPNERVQQSTDRLAARPVKWASLAPVLLALDPLGTAARQEQSLEKVKDWVARLDDALLDVDRIKEEPRYSFQKKDQEGITTDLRAILDVNKRRAETVGNDADLTEVFSVLKTALENAADASALAAQHLGRELPQEANVKQNEVIHLLITVRDRVGPELKMDKNKYAMNEQMLARVQRMIIKQKICAAQVKVIWDKRTPDGTYGRTETLRLDACARDQGSLEEDIKVGWEIINTAHNVGFGLFPPEARILLELARSDVQVAAKRIQGYDPGLETQRVQAVILERLLAIAKLLGPGFAEGPPELDRSFTYDSFLSRMSLHNTRVNDIGLLLTLQEEINRRLPGVENARRAGKAGPAVEQEAEQLRLFQEHIRQGLERWAFADARSWMAADWMPTAYGTNKGGAVQGRVAPSLKE